MHTGSVAAKLFFVDNDGETLFFWAKLQFLLLALLLGGFIYRWSKELFGFERIGIAVSLWLAPDLAHSQYCLCHRSPSLGYFLSAAIFFWCALEKLTWSRARYGWLLRFGGSHEIRRHSATKLWQSGAHWPCP